MTSRCCNNATPHSFNPSNVAILGWSRVELDLSANPAQNYFLARLEIDPAQLVRLHGVRLTPGMPAETFIQTGERTLVD